MATDESSHHAPQPLDSAPALESLICPNCGKHNTTTKYCGDCGSSLDFKKFISNMVSEEVRGLVGDKTVLETDAAIRVGERVWGWLKIIGGVVLVFGLLLSFLGFYKYQDMEAFINASKSVVATAASQAKSELQSSSLKALQEVQKSAGAARRDVSTASDRAVKESLDFQASADKAKKELGASTQDAERRVKDLTAKVASADSLQAEMTHIRSELEKALGQLERQQKLLANQELFVKELFSSYKTESFDTARNSEKYMALPAIPKGAWVYFLLEESPIHQTIQIQHRVAIQPKDSYVSLGNIVFLNWGDSLEVLSKQLITVSYFPDRTSKVNFKKLRLVNGALFADDLRLPVFMRGRPKSP